MQEINFLYDLINRNILLVNNMQQGFVNVLTKVIVNFNAIFSKKGNLLFIKLLISFFWSLRIRMESQSVSGIQMMMFLPVED